MKVYRFETAEGGGVYRGSSYIIWSVVDEDSARHPYPFSDDRLFNARKAAQPANYYDLDHEGQQEWQMTFLAPRFFGFESIEHARNWFYEDDWLIHFHKHGIRLAIYEVDDDKVILGDTQCIFMRDGNTPKQQFDILEYFNLKETN